MLEMFNASEAAITELQALAAAGFMVKRTQETPWTGLTTTARASSTRSRPSS